VKRRVLRRAAATALLLAPAAGLLAPAAGLLAPAAGLLAPAAGLRAPAAGELGPPVVQTVASGPSRRYGEAIALGTGSGLVAGATSFAGGSAVSLWTEPSGSAAWSAAGQLLPAGFSASYDAAVAPGPDGSALVVAGASEPGPAGCLNGGSVVAERVDPASGARSAAVVIDDERGRAGFDDRPAVATGPGGTVWAAWSHGPPADCAQLVGAADTIQVALSTDGGATFGPPATLPRMTAGAAFGVSVVPLAAGGAYLVWTEVTGSGSLAVVGDHLASPASAGTEQLIATGTALPPQRPLLPGASFYEFTVARAVELAGGQLACVWPEEQAGSEVLALASASGPGAAWSTAIVPPPPGEDLLLGALAPAGAGRALLVFAQHNRTGDALGYGWDPVAVPASGPPVLSPPQTLVPEEPGPGFYELGEVLSVLPSSAPSSGTVAAFVAAGASESRVEVAIWPPLAAGSPAAKPGSASPTPARGANRSSLAPASSPAGASGGGEALVAVAVVAALAAGFVGWRRSVVRRRSRRPGGQREYRGPGP
jgi:hypothetical protein